MDYKEKVIELLKSNDVTDEQKEKLKSIFPELKESEDERIRKALIKFVKSRLAGFPECDKYIAWLEKQGEHANFRNKIQVGDKVTRNRDGELVNLSQLKRVAKKDEWPRKMKSKVSKSLLIRLSQSFMKVIGLLTIFVMHILRQ